MIEEGKVDLYAAMYQDDEEETEAPLISQDGTVATPPTPARGIMSMPAMSAEIRRMQKTIDDQERLIRQLTNRVKAMERHINKYAGHLNDIKRDLDGKLDAF